MGCWGWERVEWEKGGDVKVNAGWEGLGGDGWCMAMKVTGMRLGRWEMEVRVGLDGVRVGVGQGVGGERND